MPNVAASFIRGRQAADAEAEHQQQLEDSKLRQKILKNQIDRLKIEDEVRGRELQLENFKLLQGQPEASLPRQQVTQPNLQSRSNAGAMSLPDAISGLVRENMAAPQAQAVQPETNVTSRIAPVNIPGVEAFGVPGISLTPQSMEDLLRAQVAAKYNDPAAAETRRHNLATEDAAMIRATRPSASSNPNDVSVALQAAGGDPAKALELLKAQRATTAQDRLVPVMDPATGKPVLKRQSQAEGMAPANTRETGRQVTSGDVGRITDLDSSLNDLAVLTQTISGVAGATGIGAQIGAALPKWATNLTGWGTDAKKKQAVIDRVKQVIGKALEGGVLRKEDEIKYERILPTIGDPPEVVTSKLQGLAAAITQRREQFLENLESANYDTSRFKQRAPKQDSEGTMIEARDPQGNIHHAPKGTPLPAGWVLVK